MSFGGEAPVKVEGSQMGERVGELQWFENW